MKTILQTHDARDYLKSRKSEFLDHFLKGYEPLEENIAYFTAGPSGAGKTEFAQYMVEEVGGLIHLDIDAIREFFEPIGYDGSNSDLFQGPSSLGMHYLFDEAIKKRGLSVVVDSNFASLEMAQRNIRSLLKRNYRVEIIYIYDDLEKCFLYTKKRESVTKRRVPEDVFFRNARDSRITAMAVKRRFGDQVALHLFDKRTEDEYFDMMPEGFEEIVPEIKEC